MSTKRKGRSRWKCTECGSTKIQVGLPAWHRETLDCELTYIETDFEADIMWWYCEKCGHSDSGTPIDLMKHPCKVPATP